MNAVLTIEPLSFGRGSRRRVEPKDSSGLVNLLTYQFRRRQLTGVQLGEAIKGRITELSLNTPDLQIIFAPIQEVVNPRSQKNPPLFGHFLEECVEPFVHGVDATFVIKRPATMVTPPEVVERKMKSVFSVPVDTPLSTVQIGPGCEVYPLEDSFGKTPLTSFNRVDRSGRYAKDLCEARLCNRRLLTFFAQVGSKLAQWVIWKSGRLRHSDAQYIQYTIN